MFNLKNLSYFLCASFTLSVLINSQTLPTQAQNSPSAGQAGVTSGTPPAPNNTTVAVPPTATVTSTSGNVIVNESGQISVPTNVLTNVNNTAQVVVTSNAQGTTTQREVAAVVSSSVSPSATSLSGILDAPVLVEIVTITPNADGTSDTTNFSQQIRNINDLSIFVQETIGTIVTTPDAVGEILIGGLTIIIQ